MSDIYAASHDHPSGRYLALVLEALPPHVVRLGWSKAALDAAATEAGVSQGQLLLAAPNGVADVIDAFVDRADREMLADLAEMDLAAMRIRQRVRTAVERRILAQAPYKDAVRRLGPALASPTLMGLGPRLVWRTADRIWRALDDPSTDFNFYSKRAILSGVLAATYARWLQDEDPEAAATWAFLDARIEGVMQFEKLKARVKPIGEAAGQVVSALAGLRYRSARGGPGSAAQSD